MGVKTARYVSDKTLLEIELLRLKLYAIVNGRREMLNTKEICEVSRQLDKLIVKHMNSVYKYLR